MKTYLEIWDLDMRNSTLDIRYFRVSVKIASNNRQRTIVRFILHRGSLTSEIGDIDLKLQQK